MFKDHHIVAKPSTTSVGYDKWSLSNTLWMKLCNSHGKYKPELNEYFHMHRCQLNFALFCSTSALGISWQHLNHPNLLVQAVCRFHVYFHVQLILHDLGIPLPHGDGFSKVHITVSVMTVALTRMKHGCMVISFIRMVMVFLVIR